MLVSSTDESQPGFGKVQRHYYDLEKLNVITMIIEHYGIKELAVLALSISVACESMYVREEKKTRIYLKNHKIVSK